MLGRVIDHVGLEDAGELVALATTDQLRRIFDDDLWHAPAPGKDETFDGEDRGDVVRFAHAAIDAGADIVIGQGPHVPRAVELYRGHLIAYSLGNFWTYEGVMNYAVSGLGPVLEAWLAPDGTVAGLAIH